MSVAFGFKLQTGFQRVWSDSNFLVENDISIKWPSSKTHLQSES